MLDHLLREWKTTYDNMMALTGNLRQQIIDAQEQIDELEGPYRETLAHLEEQMKPLVNADTPRSHPGVMIVYRNGYERFTWDGKALEGYAVADPKVLNFRKKTEVAPSVKFERTDE